jgi:signal transduction histidine kinase
VGVDGRGKVLTVLLIEDSTDDRDLLVLELRNAGFEPEWRQVALADPLREALRESWDLVLCDYHLPNFGAVAALEIVRELGIDVPFIIVSAVLGEEAAVAVMKAGAHDFFAKHRLARLGAAIERELMEVEVRRARRRAEEGQRHMLEQLQRAVKVRDEFLVIASHELRTPLTALGLQVARLGRSGAEVDGPIVSRVNRQVERLAHVVERLIDVTTLSSEPLRLVRTSTDLGRLVRDVVERSQECIEQAGCSISFEPFEEAVGLWDSVRLDTVVTNLLDNALKFGAGKAVRLSVVRLAETALFSIRDQGIGIDDEQRAGLFRKFARAVPVTNYGGFGLGLWIVDQLVSAHGGYVRVSSRKGEGAKFTVELPV